MKDFDYYMPDLINPRTGISEGQRFIEDKKVALGNSTYPSRYLYFSVRFLVLSVADPV